MSRGRARSVLTHKIVPDATLVVPRNQADEYRNAGYGLDIVPIPDNVIGVSAVRNCIIRTFAEDCIVMFDDDVIKCVTLVNLRNRSLTPAEIDAVVENAAYCALGAGARLFGFNQRADPRVLQRNDPISFTAYVGGVVGVIGKDVVWDELLKTKCDIDAGLSECLKRRILWHEKRFNFVALRDRNAGGCSLIRSPERVAAEIRYLSSKWKAHLLVEQYKTNDRLLPRVERRQHYHLAD